MRCVNSRSFARALFVLLFLITCSVVVHAGELEKFSEFTKSIGAYRNPKVLNKTKGAKTPQLSRKEMARQLKAINGYLTKLSDDSYFDLIDEVGVDSPEMIVYQTYFTSHIYKRWDKVPPLKRFAKEITAKDRSPAFRVSLIDNLKFIITEKIENGDLTDKKFKSQVYDAVDAYKSIAIDKKENIGLRVKCTSKLAGILELLKLNAELSDSLEKEFSAIFNKILRDNYEDGNMQSRALAVLEGLGDTSYISYLKDIIKNTKSKNVSLMRSATIKLGRIKDKGSYQLILNLLNETDNNDIIRTSLYILETYKNPEIIKTIMNNKERFKFDNPRRTYCALFKEILEDIFQSEKRQYYLEALEFVKIYECDKRMGKYIYNILKNDPDPKIRKTSIDTLFSFRNNLSTTDSKKLYKKIIEFAKNEKDPSVLESLKEIKKRSKNYQQLPVRLTDDAEADEYQEHLRKQKLLRNKE